MSQRGLTYEELEKLLLESSDSETEDIIIRAESETESESGDSDDDPEWLPPEEMESQVLAGFSKVWPDKNIEADNPPIPKRLKKTQGARNTLGETSNIDIEANTRVIYLFILGINFTYWYIFTF